MKGTPPATVSAPLADMGRYTARARQGEAPIGFLALPTSTHRGKLALRFVLLLLLSLFLGRVFASSSPDRAVAFDQYAGKLERGEIAPDTQAGVLEALAHMKSLLPPGDARRELRYRYMYCIMGLDASPEQAIAYAEKGIADARRLGYVDAEINFDFCRGSNQEALTTPRDALVDYNAGINLARSHENQRLVADGLTWRGSVQSLLGEHALALVDFLEAQKFYETSGAPIESEDNLFNIAVAYRRLGEQAQARDYLDKLLALGEQRHDRAQQLAAHMELGFLESEAGNQSAAESQLGKALALAHAVDSRSRGASIHLGLAQVDNLQGHYREALDELAKAQPGFARMGDRSNRDMVLLQTAEAHAGLGQYAVAIGEYGQAEKLLQESGNLRYLAELLDARARSYQALGQLGPEVADLRRLVKVGEALDRKAHSDNATLMNYQFQTAQRDQENRRLAADRALKEQQLESLERVRHWQRLALVLGGVLIVLLLWLALRQFRRSRKLHRMAMTDPLTGIANRRHIEQLARNALGHAGANGEPLCVLVLDVDHFKAVNDAFGHAVGDQVLVRVAQACKHALRRFDMLGRLGGEEFLVVLPDTSMDVAMQIAERLRRKVESLPLGSLAPGLQITASVGVAEAEHEADDLPELVRRADTAMYRAKDAGRNRVEVVARAQVV
ncbi:diguanylate cyclase (GGDEF) domain-containing protein [Frateuria terrea]|uniref:diguanylate cyclase n=1 Tax=Frateuria terrea TaxID=529704 RepID=A0A1H6ZHI7_9GAMM|nr:diguanylate cyclase (GGDEF) domain-containing protein [Frateuria terrea]SFP46639.1 diguanylate cyclase (GGDEF) domain-containing protein [Frateuria terrea]